MEVPSTKACTGYEAAICPLIYTLYEYENAMYTTTRNVVILAARQPLSEEWAETPLLDWCGFVSRMLVEASNLLG